MKSRIFAVLSVLVAVAGLFGLGFLAGTSVQGTAGQASAGHEDGGHHAADNEAEAAAHEHPAFEVPAGEPKPQVSIELLPDGHHGDGWNIHISTNNFAFAPQHASGPHIPGEGHAHLFINGEKISRIYGTWHHISRETAGRGALDIRVALYTNDHNAYVVDGKPVEASAIVMSF